MIRCRGGCLSLPFLLDPHSVVDPGGCHWRMPPEGPDSFVLTYKFFETELPRELASPLQGWRPPTGNPGSAADTGSYFPHCT